MSYTEEALEEVVRIGKDAFEFSGKITGNLLSETVSLISEHAKMNKGKNRLSEIIEKNAEAYVFEIKTNMNESFKQYCGLYGIRPYIIEDKDRTVIVSPKEDAVRTGRIIERIKEDNLKERQKPENSSILKVEKILNRKIGADSQIKNPTIPAEGPVSGKESAAQRPSVRKKIAEFTKSLNTEEKDREKILRTLRITEKEKN